jgi:predicted dehydrogenase
MVANVNRRKDFYMPSKLKVAFMGFRHGHIFAVHNLCRERDDVEIVAACEEHLPTFKKVKAEGNVALAYSDYMAMLEELPSDIVAVGEAYGRRGKVIIEALKRGKHVIGDKPICTSLKECEEIVKLAKAKNLKIGCQLDMRYVGTMAAIRELIQAGEAGEVCAISFGGQHPLSYGTRAEWYFEE